MLDPIAWFAENNGWPPWGIACSPFEPDGERCGPQLSGLKGSNLWGLYDILGNAAEWVADQRDPGQAVPAERVDPLVWRDGRYARRVRGGGWSSAPSETRLAARDYVGVTQRLPAVGFRMARTLDDTDRRDRERMEIRE